MSTPRRARIVILPGDGIGPEVTAEAVRVLQAVAARFDHDFTFETALIGGAAIDETDDPLPSATLETCRAADAILLGAVGGPKWASHPTVRPEQGLLRLRQGLGLYANLRPIRTHPALAGASPLKPDRIANVDIMVVRELTGGIYFGEKEEGAERASDLCTYTRKEVERVVRLAAQLASDRGGRLVSVDKANVLATSRLWRQVTTELLAEEFPALDLEHLLVDAMAMHLIHRPSAYDVIVTENMFGDILTDEASMLAGSLGLLPSASLNGEALGLYEPIHGSAPDIAGQGIANPYGAIASAALLLRHSLDLSREALLVERAVDEAIAAGALTRDLAAHAPSALSTAQAGEAVLAQLDRY
ncbi:MAG: 3-isopropylmalate dehydrogenase [Pseudomonadota bacterium]